MIDFYARNQQNCSCHSFLMDVLLVVGNTSNIWSLRTSRLGLAAYEAMVIRKAVRPTTERFRPRAPGNAIYSME
jgi:hypothetical protein